MKQHILSSLSLFLLASTLPAAVTFVPISSVTSDTAGTDFFPAIRLIEGPGVGFDSAEPYNRTSGLTWVTNAPNGGAGDYFGPTPTPSPRLVFDLGSISLFNELNFWGYADTNGNGANAVDVRFSNTGTTPGDFTGAPLSLSLTQLVTPRQNFFIGTTAAQYIEVIPTDNFFGISPPGGDRVGLGEFAVSIPEPSRALLGALGLACLALRRRRD